MKELMTLFIGITLLLTGCDAIFENDISHESLDVIIPAANDTLETNNIHFKWNELDGATFYNLQIVKSSFDDLETFILDSNINNNEFFQILPPGEYAYKIRAENSVYQTEYTSEKSFYVDSVSDLSGQAVLIISPVDNQYMSGDLPVVMQWQNLYSADRYDYVLKSGASFATGSILDQVLGQVTLSKTIDADIFALEGIYYCGVRGVNNSNATAYSYRTIYIDKTAPNSPDLVRPLNLAINSILEPIVFKWNNGTDPGTVHSEVTSIFEVSTSESFLDYETVDGIRADSLSYTFSETGDYWWRVYNTDAVGNVSEFYSEERQITIE